MRIFLKIIKTTLAIQMVRFIKETNSADCKVKREFPRHEDSRHFGKINGDGHFIEMRNGKSSLKQICHNQLLESDIFYSVASL